MIWSDRNDSHLGFAALLIIYATLQQSQVVRVSNESLPYFIIGHVMMFVKTAHV